MTLEEFRVNGFPELVRYYITLISKIVFFTVLLKTNPIIVVTLLIINARYYNFSFGIDVAIFPGLLNQGHAILEVFGIIKDSTDNYFALLVYKNILLCLALCFQVHSHLRPASPKDQKAIFSNYLQSPVSLLQHQVHLLST